LFAVVSVCYRCESVCVFAVEPRQEIQELNWDTNGMDAVRGLSAVATRPYNDLLLPCPDAQPARDAAPSRRVGAGGQCGRHERTDHPRHAKGRPWRAKKMADECRNVVVMEEKMDREANGVVKTRRDVYFISILFLKFLNINLKYILEAPAGLFWDHLFSK
jgi:hypothetical protein